MIKVEARVIAMLKKIALFVYILTLGGSFSKLSARFRKCGTNYCRPQKSKYVESEGVGFKRFGARKKCSLRKKNTQSQCEGRLEKGGVAFKSQKPLDQMHERWKMNMTAKFHSVLGKVEAVVLADKSDEEAHKGFAEGFAKQRKRFRKAVKQAEARQDILTITSPFESIWKSYKIAEPIVEEHAEKLDMKLDKIKMVKADVIGQIYACIKKMNKPMSEVVLLDEAKIRELVEAVVTEKPKQEEKKNFDKNLEAESKKKSQLILGLEIEVARLNEQISELEKLKGNSPESEEKVRQLNSRLEFIEEEKAKLKVDLDKSKVDLDKSKEEAVTTKGKLDEEVSKAKKMEADLKSSSEEKIASQAKSKQLEDSVSELNRKVQGLESMLVDKKLENRTLQEKMQNSASALEEAKIESRLTREHIVELNADLDKKRSEIRSLNNDLQSLVEQQLATQIKMNQALHAKGELKEQLEALQEEKKSLIRDKKFVEDDLNRQLSKIKNKNREIDRMYQERETLQLRLDGLNEMVREVEAGINGNQDRIVGNIDKLNKKIKILTENIEVSDTEKAEMMESLNKLKLDSQEKDKKLVQLENGHAEAAVKIGGIDEQLKQKEVELKNHAALKSDLEKKINQQKGLEKEKNSKVKTLQAADVAGKSKLVSMTHENDKLQKEADELKNQIKQLSKEKQVTVGQVEQSTSPFRLPTVSQPKPFNVPKVDFDEEDEDEDEEDEVVLPVKAPRPIRSIGVGVVSKLEVEGSPFGVPKPATSTVSPATTAPGSKPETGSSPFGVPKSATSTVSPATTAPGSKPETGASPFSVPKPATPTVNPATTAPGSKPETGSSPFSAPKPATPTVNPATTAPGSKPETGSSPFSAPKPATPTVNPATTAPGSKPETGSSPFSAPKPPAEVSAPKSIPRSPFTVVKSPVSSDDEDDGEDAVLAAISNISQKIEAPTSASTSAIPAGIVSE